MEAMAARCQVVIVVSSNTFFYVVSPRSRGMVER